MAFHRSQNLLCASLVTVLLMIAVGTVVAAGTPVKDFTLPSATDARLLHLSDFSGKVVLINWWRTSCGWSQRESPKLVEVYKNYRDQGLVILGVSDDTSDTVAQIPSYLKKYGITWPVGLNDRSEFLHEVVLPMSQEGGRPAGETPGNYIVTRSGQMTYLGLDRSPEAWEKLVGAVKQALNEKAPVTPLLKPRKLEPAPPLALPDLMGKKVTLANFADEPLVVNFFTSQTCDWTGAVISKLHRDYAGRGLQVVGVDLYDSDDAVRQCTQKYEAQYPVLRGDQATQMAWIGGTNAWATFFITPNGKVLKKIVDSIEKGIEDPVFTKYAEYLVSKR